jgi:phosphatidylglycerophosphate synthase
VWWPAILLFFFIVSILVYFLSMRARRKDMRKFANFYMASTVVKMILYLTIIFVYVLNFKEDGKRFAITFLIYYLIYSVFETFKLAKKEKKKIDGE